MRFSVVNALALAVALCACGKSESQTPSEVLAAPVPPASPALVDAGLQAHMRDHFESIRSIERAIVAGDLTVAKEQATKLALHQSGPEVQMYSDEFQAVRDAAMAIAASETHADMASRAAALASQCGYCHLITSSSTSFEWSEAPTSNQTGAERMQRHRWAMDRLWEGLVGPSEQSWTAGAALLGEAPASAEGLALGDMAEADAKARFAALEELGRKARSATDQAERTAVYGELLSTCSDCHSTVQAGK